MFKRIRKVIIYPEEKRDCPLITGNMEHEDVEYFLGYRK